MYFLSSVLNDVMVALLSTCFWKSSNIATKLALVSLHVELQFQARKHVKSV